MDCSVTVLSLRRYMEKEKRNELIAAIATPIAKSQHMRQIWFYVMSGGITMKILVMEVAKNYCQSVVILLETIFISTRKNGLLYVSNGIKSNMYY